MYQKIRPALFKLDAERSHDLSIKALQLASQNQAVCRQIKKYFHPQGHQSAVNVMGLEFPNRIGLAAGLDKHAQCINAFTAMGFGFIEAGTVTPAPQAGNEKPRLFRLTEHNAIINRMGFNSVGLEQFLENFSCHNSNSIVGINLGKNAATPMNDAASDYITGMQKTYLHADYLTINLSSPNTKQLRELQRGDSFEQLVMILKREQKRLTDKHGKYTPLAIKVAPDLEPEEIHDIAGSSMRHNIDAIIATNTTIKRDMLGNHPLAKQAGGLSGEPVRILSTKVIKSFAHILKGEIPIIGVGGISSGRDALDKINAGASLIQVYTGLIYKGPALIKEIAKSLNSSNINQSKSTD